MTLTGPYLDTIVELLKNAFNRSSLSQLVGSCLQEDVYKEWCAPNQSLKEDLYQLLPKLAGMGLLAILLDRVATERSAIADELATIRDVLGIKTTTTSDQTTAITGGVASVMNKLQIPAVRAVVSKSQGVIGDLTAKIELLGAYKNLHDELHDARMGFRRLQTTAKLLATGDPDAGSEFRDTVMLMESIVEDIDKIWQDLPTAPFNVQQDELQLKEPFAAAVALAVKAKAAKPPDAVVAKQSVQAMSSVLATQPSRIDKLLSDTAGALDLSKLSSVFADAALVPELADEATSLDQGRIGTEQLLRDIKSQVAEHGAWQIIERKLDSSDNFLKPADLAEDPTDFSGLWKGLMEAITPLMSAEPDAEWAKLAAENIATVERTCAARDWAALKNDFARFRQDATTQFVAVDKRLKKLAKGVNTLAAPLRNLLAPP